MAYVALYRAYRPRKFSEVVGQEHIIKTLQNAIKLNKVAHAYLFCGPRGTGKTTFAKILAKAMNCEFGPAIEPCCKCAMCEGIAKGTVSDVIEIDAASNNGADDIRALRDTVNFMPAAGKYKIYIIDEVHMLTTQAFNALLKTLEEPPKHVIFILATTEAHKLPATILSRCQRFDFQSISIENIIKRLNVVKEEENIKISEEALYQIAISAEGGMRDALSLLDQAISYSVNEEISLEDVLAISGSTSYMNIIELLDACIDEGETKAIVILDKILKMGKEVPRLINDIILFLRDSLLYINNAYIEDKMMYKNEKFKMLVAKLSKGVIYAWLDILNETLNNTKFSIQKRAFLELAILKMNDVKLNEEAKIVDRIVSLERNFDMLSRQMATMPTEVAPRNNFVPNIPTNQDIEKLILEQKRLEEEAQRRLAEQNRPQTNYQEPTIIEEPPVIEEEAAPTLVQEEPAPTLFQEEVVKETPIVETQPEVQVEPEVTQVAPQPEPAPTNKRVIKLAPPDEINVIDLERIIHNNDALLREDYQKKWNNLENVYTNLFEAQILSRGKLVAVANNTIIVTLLDASFCNRIMSYNATSGIIDFLKQNGIMVDDFICVPKAIWKELMDEYRVKMKTTDKPEFEDRRIGVKRRTPMAPEPEVKEDPNDPMNLLNELFPNGTIKIED